MRILPHDLLFPALLSLPVAIGTAPRTDVEPLPVEVQAVATPVTDEGTFTLRLACRPLEDFPRRYSLRVAISSNFDDLSVTEHELTPPTSRWRAGQRVDCAVDLTLPFEHELVPEEYLAVRIGFVAEPGGDARPPRVELELVDSDDLTQVAEVTVPRYAGTSGQTRLDEAIAEASKLATKGDVAGAWAVLDETLRNARDDTTKARVRDELAKVGKKPPGAPTEHEEEIIGQRIRGEKVRVFRLEAGRMFGRGELFGALALLEEAGGNLAVDADEKVIGALADAERTMKRVEDIQTRILTDITEADQAVVDALVEEHGRTAKLLEAADELAEQRRYPPALALYRKLRRVDGIELYDTGQVRLEEVGDAYLADIPPDQAEKVRDVLEHPTWERTDVVASHCFLFIGPRKLVEGIPSESKLRFDQAYVYLTDLFGRIPNPDGDRVTVYFKELWDFGGGVGGGKIINIGNADPSPGNPVRVDNGLLYHELTHCIDDTKPTHSGFGEGLANVGAAFAHEVLEQQGDALHSFDANLRAFQRYFVERDLEYWRIQNYGPSAGLFLHFVDTYAARGRGEHDWTPLRRFFREYREAPVRDGREPFVARSLAHYLERAFGPEVFDDLVEFGFPLEESDRGWLGRELDSFGGFGELEDFDARFAEHPNSPLPRDILERELSEASSRSDLEGAAVVRKELGVIFEWKVIGPFFAKRADSGAHPFGPEREIDFATKPESWRSSRDDRTQLVWQDPYPSWKPTRSHKNVKLHPTGWLHFDYEPYGDDGAAIYALTHVTLQEAADATAHLRADDDVMLFVNDRRVTTYESRGRNGSSDIGWRGPFERAPDGMRAAVHFEAGRNKVLVKIKNNGGTAGLIAAFSRPDGSHLEFTHDPGPPDEPGPRTPVEEPSWKRLQGLDHRSYRSKTKVEVGSFRAANKAFYGADTGGGVAWRMFTVRPGFPKDSPSNLLWLRPNLTDDLDAVRVDVELASTAAPKMLLTIQGEGENDGLSGWNLILVPSGKDAVLARLERYDRLVYQSDPVELAAASDGRVLSVLYWDGWYTATIDGEPLLDRVSIHPIAGRHRIGIATWGQDPTFRNIELSRGK